MGWRLTAWLAGEDAYEGLTLYLHAHRFPVYSTPEMDFDGVIFEGEPPVMLEAVEILPSSRRAPPQPHRWPVPRGAGLCSCLGTEP